MAHPMPTKRCLQLSPEAAMLLGPVLKPTHLPLSHAFYWCRTQVKRTLLKVTSQAESYMMHICNYRV